MMPAQLLQSQSLTACSVAGCGQSTAASPTRLLTALCFMATAQAWQQLWLQTWQTWAWGWLQLQACQYAPVRSRCRAGLLPKSSSDSLCSSCTAACVLHTQVDFWLCAAGAGSLYGLVRAAAVTRCL